MNRLKRIVIILGIVLIVVFAAIVISEKFVGLNSSKPAFETLDGQFALLDKTYATWFGEKIQVTSYYQGRALLCDWYYYKALAAERDKTAEEAADKFKAQLQDFVMMTTLGGEYWAAEAAMDELYPFYNGVPGARESIIENCRQYAPELEKHIDSDRATLMALAQNEGFLLENGQLNPEKDNIIRLLHRQNWNTIVIQQLPSKTIIPPEERLAFLRWQIEQARIPYEKKFKKLEFLHTFYNETYDYHYAKAVLLYQTEKFADACSALKIGLNETDKSNNFRVKRYQNAIHYMAHEHPAFCAKDEAPQGNSIQE